MAKSVQVGEMKPVAAPAPGAMSLEEVPLERLESEITELAAHLNAAECRRLSLVAKFDRRKGWWGTWECRSCAHWLNWKCSIDLGAARERVRVARTLGQLPNIHRRLRRRHPELLQGSGP